MQPVQAYLEYAMKNNAADVFFVAGKPVSAKFGHHLISCDDHKLTPEDTAEAVSQIYRMARRPQPTDPLHVDDDFSMAIPNVARYRVNVYKQRGTLAAVIRIIKFGIPDYKSIGIPENIMDLWRMNRGMVLITGTTGSGKSTTIACIIDLINRNRESHIITIEDPIEFVYRNESSIISQRELATDTPSYSIALRASLRQAPDVIMLGELRDLDTIQTAITAAETGHLVISTLHTLGAANTIDRIVDVFPAAQQQQIRTQISQVLKTVISQQLVPTVDGKRAPAFEIMHLNPAIRGHIRDGRIHQIDQIIQQNSKVGMISMDDYLINLWKHKIITRETAIDASMNPAEMPKRLFSATHVTGR